MHSLVILTDPQLVAMAKRANFVAEFPFLTSLLPVAPADNAKTYRCPRRCQEEASSSQTAGHSLNSVKKQLAALTPMQQRVLKDLLQTRAVSFSFIANGQPTQVRF